MDIVNCKDCYRHSNNAHEPFWFSKPCPSIRHELVYAKQMGYSFWPAKVVRKITANRYDVRYFGPKHLRGEVTVNNVRPITTPKRELKLKKSTGLDKALDELRRHLDLLEQPIEQFAWRVTSRDKDLVATVVKRNKPTSAEATSADSSSVTGKKQAVSVTPKATAAAATGHIKKAKGLHIKLKKGRKLKNNNVEKLIVAEAKRKPQTKVIPPTSAVASSAMLNIDDDVDDDNDDDGGRLASAQPAVAAVSSSSGGSANRRKRKYSFTHIYEASKSSDEDSLNSTISDYIAGGSGGGASSSASKVTNKRFNTTVHSVSTEMVNNSPEPPSTSTSKR